MPLRRSILKPSHPPGLEILDEHGRTDHPGFAQAGVRESLMILLSAAHTKSDHGHAHRRDRPSAGGGGCKRFAFLGRAPVRRLSVSVNAFVTWQGCCIPRFLAKFVCVAKLVTSKKEKKRAVDLTTRGSITTTCAIPLPHSDTERRYWMHLFTAGTSTVPG